MLRRDTDSCCFAVLLVLAFVFRNAESMAESGSCPAWPTHTGPHSDSRISSRACKMSYYLKPYAVDDGGQSVGIRKSRGITPAATIIQIRGAHHVSIAGCRLIHGFAEEIELLRDDR